MTCPQSNIFQQSTILYKENNIKWIIAERREVHISYFTNAGRLSVGWQMRRCWWSSWAASCCSYSPSPSSSATTTARKSGGQDYIALLLILSDIFNSFSYRKVRSRLYSRLYSERDYHHVIRKSDLKAVVENKLKEILPFSEEFERYIQSFILDNIKNWLDRQNKIYSS